MKLTQRVNYFILPVVLLAFSLTGVLTFQGIKTTARDDIGAHLQAELEGLHYQVQLELRASRAIMRSLLTVIDSRSKLIAESRSTTTQKPSSWIDTELSKMRAFNTNINSAQILNASGAVVAGDSEQGLLNSFGKDSPAQRQLQDYLASVRDGSAPVSSDFFYYSSSGSLMHAEMERLESDLEGEYIALWTEEITALKSTYNKLVGTLGEGISMRGHAFEKPASSSGSASFETHISDRGDLIAGYYGASYKLVVRVPAENLAKMFENTKRYLTIMVLSITLICFIAIRLLIWRQLVKPINTLVESIKNCNHEQLEIQPVARNDELGELQNAYIGMLRDMHQLAFFDPLTGLANRRNFQSALVARLDEAKRHGQQLALLFVDLDNFKRVNDQFGHATGDELLRKFSQRLRESIRPSDFAASLSENSLARLAGDEFALLLSGNPSAEGVSQVATRILELLKDGFEVNGITQNIQASIGIAISPQDGTSAEDLLSHADAAMYETKASGRNRYKFFNQGIALRLERQRRIEMLLSAALERGDLRPKLEPVFDNISMLCTSFDVQLGLPSLEEEGISLEDIIVVAESAGIIKQLDLHAVERAAGLLNRLRDHGFQGHICVELSAHALNGESCIADICQLISRQGVRTEDIELNIRQPQTPGPSDEWYWVLEELRARGFTLSTSAFKDGRLALNEIAAMPLQSLRIDHKLVQNIGSYTREKLSMADFVLSIAALYKFDTIAARVQTDMELGYLRSKGCSHVKGSYLAASMDIDAAINFISKPKAGAGMGRIASS